MTDQAPPLAVGQFAERVFKAADEAVRAFADISGDRNPVHLDDAYAATTAFRGRVAHGMLAASYISAVLGEELPGPGVIYLGQTLEFVHPIRIGDEVAVRVEVIRIEDGGRKAVLATSCTVDGRVVVSGEAVTRPPRRRKAAIP